jgi:hypothetical protein
MGQRCSRGLCVSLHRVYPPFAAPPSLQISETLRAGVSVVGNLSKGGGGPGHGGVVITPRMTKGEKREVGASRAEKMMSVAHGEPTLHTVSGFLLPH